MKAVNCTNFSNVVTITVTSDTNIRMYIISEYQIAFYIWAYCPPALIVLGAFGNMATITVLCKIRWKGSTMHHHLIGLALSDMCLLLTGLLRRWIKFVFNTDVRDLHWLGCKLHVFLTYSTSTMSAWFLVFVTAQRTMAILWPNHVQFLCSTKRSKTSLAVVVVCSLGVCIPALKGSELSTRCMFSDYFTKFITAWYDMALSSLLPSLILASCNVILIWNLRRSVEDRSLGTAANNIATRKKTVSSLTVTLVVVSLTFLALTLPVCVYFIFFTIVFEGSEVIDETLLARSELASAVTNMLWYTNSSINFLLYCVSGKKFRREFLAFFCDTRRRTTVSESTRHTLNFEHDISESHKP